MLDTKTLMVYLLFIIGFFALIYGAEWLVDGASALAKKIGVSGLVIGLTVVAFGTSLPELIVSLFAVNSDAGALAIGNVLGSNIANTLLVLGVIAIITPIYIRRVVVWREVLFSLAATVMLGVLVADTLLANNDHLFIGLSRIDGIVLISYFLIFLYYTFGKTWFPAESEEKPAEEEHKHHTFDIPNTIVKIIGGSLALFIGGKWIVNGAIEMADALNISQGFIGLTIVAIGTSLPELAASVVAVRKKKEDIAVGNVVGSNLFNILWVLGLSATVAPLPFAPEQLADVLLAIAVALILFFTLTIGKHKHQISRSEGVMFLVLYGVYLVYISGRSLGVF